MFGKTYYPAEVFKFFDRVSYEKELQFYFESNDLYTKICTLNNFSCEYYRTFQVRKILNLTHEALPTNWCFNWRGKE